MPAGTKRLARGSTALTHIYDGDGNRVKAVVNGTTGIFVGNYFEITGGITRTYYYTGGQLTTYRFTGQRWDSGTGLYFYNARWYDPFIGRFLSADTIVPQPGNPQSLNRYSYTLNNPLNLVDPTGHWSIPPIGPIVREMARIVSNLPWMASVAYASYREAKGDAPEALSLTLDS